MEGFTKVKTGISGLKKERDQLKASYDVMVRQLEKAVAQNSAGINALSGNAQSFSASLGTIEERVAGSHHKTEGALSTVRAETAAIRKRLEEHKNTLIDLSERVRGIGDSFQSLSKEISEARRSGKETEKALQGVGAALSGATGRIAAISSSVEGRVSAIDQKHSSALSMLRRDSESQSSVLRGHDANIKSMTLTLQSLKKDLSAIGERLARERESTILNSKKLEALGTLESKIKHIEAVKAGLVRGVESLKEMRMDMAALKQKTKDLDQKHTGADKTLDGKIGEKTDILDGKLSEKTAAMEAQMQERLKFLESTLSAKEKAMEAGMAADLDAMARSVSREVSDMKRMKELLKKADADIRTMRAQEAALRTAGAEDKKDLSALTARIGTLEDLRGRVTEIEKAKDTIVSGIAQTDAIKQKLGILSEKVRSLDTGASSDITALKADVKKTAGDVAKVNLILAGMKKDIEKSIQEDIAALRAEAMGRGASTVKMKADITSLRKTVDLKLARDIAALSAGAKKWSADITRIDMDLSGLKKTIGAGLSANVSTIKDAVRRNSTAISKSALGMAALKKDVASAGKLVTALKTEHALARRRVAALERLSERVKAAEDSGSALAAKVETFAPLSARITAISKDITVMKTAVDSSAAVLEEKIGYNLASVRKESAASTAALTKMQEDVKKLSIELRSASKDITAAKTEARSASTLVEERLSKDTVAMRENLSASAASVKKLEAALEKLTLDANSMKKDLSVSVASGMRVSGDVAGLLKKSQELEKIQVRLSEMEKGKDSLMAALEAKLAERIAFLEKSAKQAGDSLAASLSEKSAASAAAMKKESAAVSSSVEKLKARVDALSKLSQKLDSVAAGEDALSKDVSSLQDLRNDITRVAERLNALEEKKAETAKSLSALQGAKEDIAKISERLKAMEEKKESATDKDFREFRASTESALSEMRKGVESARVEGRDKFGTAVKAFLGAKTELSGKVGMIDVKVSETGRRLDELSRALVRIDALERKFDRLSEKGANIRRDVDELSRKGTASDKVMLVDLGKEDAES
jgi:chromosome segregation ATPase